VIGRLFRNKRLDLSTIVGFAMSTTMYFSLLAWDPTFLVRTYGLGNTEVGSIMGAVTMIGGTVGTLSGGLLMDRLRSSPESGHWAARLSKVC
jgi:hypothetical protein